MQPMYCGDTETYPFTGEASVVLGRRVVEGEVPNANDRTDMWMGELCSCIMVFLMIHILDYMDCSFY